MLPNATNDILAQMSQQRRQMFLAQIQDAHLEHELRNDAYNGCMDTASLAPINTNNSGWSDWLRRNTKSINPFKRAISRLIDPLKRAELQWAGDEDWSEEAKEQYKPLLARVQALKEDLALAIALHGRAGVFPWIHEGGKLKITALTQFIYPIPDEFEPNSWDAVIMFQQYKAQTDLTYMVWEFRAGMMNLWQAPTLTEYATRGQAQQYPQPHAQDRLPLAFGVLQRTPDGSTEGVGEAGISAYQKFMQRVLQENASYERAGHPQRVARGVNGSDSVDSFRAYDVLKISQPTGDVINLDASGALEQLSRARRDAADDVAFAVSAPEVSDGAGESGEARITSLEELVTTSHTIGNVVAKLLSDTTELLAAMGELPNALEFSLAPEFEAKRTAEQQSVMNLFERGLISRYQSLLELEKLGLSIDPVELEIALEERDTLKVGKMPELGELVADAADES
jgi:hypothetical protein